jgi:hypothetical protein
VGEWYEVEVRFHGEWRRFGDARYRCRWRAMLERLLLPLAAGWFDATRIIRVSSRGREVVDG